jgi:hypothetical protein
MFYVQHWVSVQNWISQRVYFQYGGLALNVLKGMRHTRGRVTMHMPGSAIIIIPWTMDWEKMCVSIVYEDTD